ncbi:macrophage mannose receptor 1-like isoform X6, partial [Clarias magur]
NFSDANKFIGISSPTLSWSDALTYCRTHYTDLASSLNSSDQNMLGQMWNKQSDSWFGVHRAMDIWRWSDGTNALNIPWYPGQPDNYFGNENCAVVYDGYFYDEQCTKLHNFFCQT